MSHDRRHLTAVSKFLSFVLRHQPQAIGLQLDREGWVAIDTLLHAAQQAGQSFDRDTLLQVVATSDKKRFTLSEDGQRIRAAQGHSTAAVAIEHTPQTPPDTLYHGTATRFWPAIAEQGLRPGSRHHVHLSDNPDTARMVGQRHGAPLVLEVAAGSMHRAGMAFFQADNGVWLTEGVPPQWLRRSETQ